MDIVAREPSMKLGRDYFNRTPKPGYTPFVYPHPLVNDVSSTPTPTPTPTPTVTNIYGTTGSNSIVGTTGNDRIWGVPASGSTASALGRGSLDTLKGNGGNDVFVLGDARGRFYDDGSSLSAGTNDYARITDFSTGDKVQLKGAASDYLLRTATLGGVTGTGVYYDTNHNHAWDTRDELIGLVSGSKTLAASDLFFV